MILIQEHTKLAPTVKNEMNTVIDNEFGHIPIVAEIEWSVPDWSIIVFEEGQIAAFVNLIERIVYMDTNAYRATGVNNLITIGKYRGKGYGQKLMLAAKQMIFDRLRAQLGILLCADHLVPFYQRLNWQKIHSTVLFNQRHGSRTWEANTMVLSLGELPYSPNQIDLNGLPW